MLLNPEHPRWMEFSNRMNAMKFCTHGKMLPHTHEILNMMGFSANEQVKQVAAIKASGCYCDCEVIFNFILPHFDEEGWLIKK
jgi:hypothetical protein